MSTFAQALTALAQGINVTRQGWLNKWYVRKGTVEHDLSVYYRHQGGEVMLWSRSTATDVEASDWCAADGGELPQASSSGFPAVLPHFIAGGSIRRGAWKDGMSVALVKVEGLDGRQIVMTLPNKETKTLEKRTTEFGPAEWVAEDWLTA